MKNKICFCTPTFKRPELLRDCLEKIAAQQTPPDSELHVVVVDNDSEQSAKVTFDNVRFSFPSSYEVEPTKGIPHARNLCLEHALAKGSTHILFVDDDMLLPPDYAKNLLAEMNRKNADAVRGKMVVVGDDRVGQKTRRASIFSRQDLLPTNGVLVGKKIFGDWGIRFDPRYVLAIEDADFFYRAYLCGARLYNAENVFFEEYRPAGRGLPKNKQEKLFMDMVRRRNHTSLRRHLGGFWRGLWFVVRQGLPLLLQIPANMLLLPFAPKKRGYKIILRAFKFYGLVSGLWMREVPGTQEAVDKANARKKH